MPTGVRRLAAILFTDLVGFTAATQSNEASSLALLREEEALVRPLVAPFGGREVKSTGDGALMEFGSALKATECAVEIQRRLHERNMSASGPKISLRVGIHVGDVEETEGDIFGDAVNVASRIVSTSEPGGICISEQVYDHVRNKLPYNLVKLEPQKLKGVRESIEVYRVVLPWDLPDAGRRAPASRRLAVLPLSSISSSPGDEYLADGLTEELISVLSQIRGLKVISRTSVVQFKGTSKSVAQIGAELGVGSILEGSVRRAGDNLRITVQLIDVESDEHRWANSYDRKLDNVFAIQAEVAEQTATALRLELVESDRESIHRGPTSSVEAYDFYLRGLAAQRNLYHDFSQVSLAETRRCFEEAIRRDPHFSAAYAALANSLIGIAGVIGPGREIFPEARTLVARALELDPSSAEAHIARGNLALQDESDWALSEREFRRGIDLNPNSAVCYGWYAMLLGTLQRYPEGREQIKQFRELDPLHEAPRRWMYTSLHQTGEDAAAVAFAHESLRSFPNEAWPHVALGLDWANRGKPDEARQELELARNASGYLGLLRLAILPRVGRAEETRTILNRWESQAPTEYVAMTWLAGLHAALGEKETALDWLERDMREGDGSIWYDYQWDQFDSLRDEPRFLSLLRSEELPVTIKRPLART